MQLDNLTCNRVHRPLGYELGRPALGWTIRDVPDGATCRFRVLVAGDEGFRKILHDSGWSETLDRVAYFPDIPLSPRTRCHWRVEAEAGGLQVSGGPEWFETGRMDEPWSARWISPRPGSVSGHPILRKAFRLDGPVRSARTYVCGLGLYEMDLNGHRAGDEFLTPGCTGYDKWIQYQTYDVTGLLRQGWNVLSVLLGNGWYKGRFSYTPGVSEIYGNRFALLCETIVELEDGRVERIATDDSWQAAESVVLDSGLYDGEIQDARRRRDWIRDPGADPARFAGVEALPDLPLPVARRGLPVRIMERLRPVAVLETPAGEQVLDMGQNMAGWVEFLCDAEEGREIRLQYGEVLQDGCFFRENLRTARAEFRYVADGTHAWVRPHFTYYGFRYVKVEGWNGKPDPERFTGCVVHSGLVRTGWIETSDPRVNQLFQNVLWGQKGNFVDIPTDCPQRDERLGWTGDAQVFSGTACFNMDCEAFFRKFLHDLLLEQRSRDGGVPPFVPSFRGDGRPPLEFFTPPGACAWGDAATILPWTLYLHYGNTETLSACYEGMKAWVDAVARTDRGSRLWDSGFHFGDWLALDGPDPASPLGGTSPVLLASAYYSHSARLVSKAAWVLGRTEDAERYESLAGEIRQAVREAFLPPGRMPSADTQTALVVFLKMDLAPEDMKPLIARRLDDRIRENGFRLQTGFIGTPSLCMVLSEYGYNETAYRLLLQEGYPGWLYAVRLGATTVWERWNSLLPDGTLSDLRMNSLNHYAYGSVVEWMYRHMCGIQPVESHPGFRRIRLAPKPNRSLAWARAVHDAPSGRIESEWRYPEGGGIEYRFAIPYGVVADVRLGASRPEGVLVNGESVSRYRILPLEDGGLAFELPGGIYQITAE